MHDTWLFSRAALRIVGTVVWALIAAGAEAEIVSFEDLPLAAESYRPGPFSNAHDEPDPYGGSLPIKVGSFSSGGLEFVNRYNLNYGSWSGFAYSNRTDTTTPGYSNQFSAATGSGAGGGDDVYAVAYGYADGFDPSDAGQRALLPYFDLPTGAQLQRALVTNTTYAALSMRLGDSFAKPFGGATGDDPDWFLLTAYGVDLDGALLPSAPSIYLADYRFADSNQDYILEEWTPWDLSSLATAARIYFNLVSSDVHPDFGLNTPGYFAIDQIEYLTAVEPSELLGDANGDCLVGAADYALWAAQFGQSGTGLTADFDSSLAVGAADYAIWAANFGETCPPPSTPVPEPSTAWLLALGWGWAGWLRHTCRAPLKR